MKKIEKTKYERVQIVANVTKEKREEIKQRAERSGRTLSSFVLRACEETPIYVIEGVPQLTNEIRSLGINLNQLTKVANSQKFIDKNMVESLQELKNELSAIGEKIDKLSNLENANAPQINPILIEIKELKELIINLIQNENGE